MQLNRGKLRGLAGLAATASVIWSLLVAGLLAQTLHPAIGERERKATVSLAEIIGNSPGPLLDQQLAQIGFVAPTAAGEWADFPVVRKLEAAYLAAEAAAKGGGADVLRSLTASLAAKYDSAKTHPDLAPFRTQTPPARIAWGPIPAESRQIAVGPAAEKAIVALSRYCESGPIGGATGVLDLYFGLSPHQTYDILRTSKTTSEAIARGLAFVPEAERDPRLELLVAHLDRHYGDTARAERDLEPWRRKATLSEAAPKIFRDPEGPGPGTQARPDKPGSDRRNRPRPSPTGNGGGENGARENASRMPGGPVTPAGDGISAGSSPEGRSRAAVEYERFVRATYGGEGARPGVVGTGSGIGQGAAEGFVQGLAQGLMQGIVEGFGGVVLGNSVQSAPALQPRQIVWVAPPSGSAGQADAMGRLVVRFDGGGEKVYGPVLSEDAWAAYHMVFEGIDGIPPMKPGYGLGLVGVEVDALVPRLSLSSDNWLVSHPTFRVVIHPAIARLSLGESTLISDVLPISPSEEAPSQLHDLVKRSSGAEATDLLDALFEDINNWKVIDAKITIGADGDRLTVTRAPDPEHARSASYLNTCFLSMNGFFSGELDPKSAARFDDLLPAILAASSDYARLNRFAAVLAVFRWARSHNATFGNPPEQPLGKEPPAWVDIEDRGIKFIGYETPADTLAAFHKEIESRLTAITAKFPPAAITSLRKEQQAYAAVAKLAEDYSNWDTETMRLKQEWGRLNASVQRAIPDSLDLSRRDYAYLSEGGFDREQFDPATAQRLNALRLRYSPSSVGEFARLRNEIQRNQHAAERERLASARKALKSDDAIRDELIALMSDEKKAEYRKLAAQQELAAKRMTEAEERERKLDQKLYELAEKEEQQLKSLSPVLQADYKKLAEKAFGSTGSTARADLIAFRRKHFSQIEAERATVNEQIQAARAEASDASRKADEARDEMETTIGQVYPALDAWLRLARYSTRLLRELSRS